MTLSDTAFAYIGPGGGLTAFGVVIALIGGILLAIVGFVWYPIKRILRKLKPASEFKRDISDPGQNMIVLVALLSVAAFLVAFSLSGIVRVALSAVEIARDAVGMMRDDALDDDAREAAVRGLTAKRSSDRHA